MARATWTGSVSFGLVNVPVALFSATEDRTVHFSQFEHGTSDRIRYRRVNERTGEEVDFGDIDKGYDLGGGEYVIVSSEELEEVDPGRSRTIEITDFVEQSEIDPVHYRSTYYLAPDGEAADRPYRLLLEAMQGADRVAIGTLVMRSKQHLAAIRPDGPVLALETMYFADEVRDPAEEIDRLPGKVRFDKRELDMARALIDSMTVPWDPERYEDTYRARVMELIEAKRRGEGVVTEGADEERAPVLDLMQALERSLGRGAGGGGKGRIRESELSRDDLYRRAKELGVPGRSKMSRDELAEAVRQAS
jgi:DNA end-binding protein Ku